MINRELRNQVDKLWTEFWTGGITNPMMVIEQISFLMFARLLDNRETSEKKANRTQRPFKRTFADDEQHLRWSQFKNKTPADTILKVISTFFVEYGFFRFSCPVFYSPDRIHSAIFFNYNPSYYTREND